MEDQAKITEAIAAAANELHNVQRQLEQLRRLEHRAKQLEDFISAGRSLVGESIGVDVPEPQKEESAVRRHVPDHAGRNPEKLTVSDRITALFEEKKRSLPLQEITQELLERKWVEGKWAREVIRTALKRGKDFERVTTGVYTFKPWPNALKRWPPEDSYPPHQTSMTGEPPQNGSLAEADTERENQSEIHREESLPVSQ